VVPVTGDPCHPSEVKRSLALTAVLLGLALGSCGEAGLLDGVGDRTREIVAGNTTTTTTLVAVAAGGEDEGLVRAADVLWFNDEIEPQYTGEPSEVAEAVWARQLGSRFVQSSRREIASALPALMFPSLVPQQVRWVTSQLVYNATTGTLDSETSAAFGLWTEEPYRSSSAQIGVLRVGRASEDVAAARSEVVRVIVPEGVSVGWTESGHRYELFCRSEVSDDLCTETAESSVALAGLVPPGR
jgi:hypothetical protein